MNVTIKYEKNITKGENKRQARWVVRGELEDGVPVVRDFYLVPGIKGARRAAKLEAEEYVRKIWGAAAVPSHSRAFARCGDKCQFAVGDVCICGCEGKNHGMGRVA